MGRRLSDGGRTHGEPPDQRARACARRGHRPGRLFLVALGLGLREEAFLAEQLEAVRVARARRQLAVLHHHDVEAVHRDRLLGRLQRTERTSVGRRHRGLGDDDVVDAEERVRENFASWNSFVNMPKNCLALALPPMSFGWRTLDHDTFSERAPRKSASDFFSNAPLIAFATSTSLSSSGVPLAMCHSGSPLGSAATGRAGAFISPSYDETVLVSK